ncbi:MAG: rane protein in aromatic hydrocarbon degradation [Myxococcaceae bacterium]|nr:rane protein in aromatic hydrocarbon degradation [Myxococcaceae bacterium]
MTLGLRSFALSASPRKPASLRLILLACAGLCAAMGAAPRLAHAGGLYLMPLGAEPAARGGARVAGANDPHALWYNPAGLAYSGRQLVVDLGLPLARASFTQYMPDGTSSATARAHANVVPIPTIAYSDDFGLRRWGFGIGIVVPPAYSLNWPSQVDGQPSPQRYSILNANGSAIASLSLAAAYRPIDRLSLGASLYITAARIGGEVAVSACDYAFCSQPEGREWEGRTKFLLGPVITATAVFGVRYDFDRFRIGGSVQVRTKIGGNAQFDVRLPDNAIFDGVSLHNQHGGDELRAKMSFDLPTIIRLGIEGDLDKNTKIELGGTWENWAVQRNITVRPIHVTAQDVPGVGNVQAQPVSLGTNQRATWAMNLGGTHELTRFTKNKRGLFAHGGFMYESSSFAPRDLSATSIDTNKVMLACGGSVELMKGLLLDVSYGHIFMVNHAVHDSRVLLPAAIRPLPVDQDPATYAAGDRPAIGNGRYAIEADFVAIGMRWKIDETREAWRKKAQN